MVLRSTSQHLAWRRTRGGTVVTVGRNEDARSDEEPVGTPVICPILSGFPLNQRPVQGRLARTAQDLPCVWVDYPDDIIRTGLVWWLLGNGIVVVGQSIGLVPEPHPRGKLIVVLDLASCERERVASLARTA